MMGTKKFIFLTFALFFLYATMFASLNTTALKCYTCDHDSDACNTVTDSTPTMECTAEAAAGAAPAAGATAAGPVVVSPDTTTAAAAGDETTEAPAAPAEERVQRLGSHSLKNLNIRRSARSVDRLSTVDYQCFSVKVSYNNSGTIANGTQRGCMEASKNCSDIVNLKKNTGITVLELCTSCKDDKCNNGSMGGNVHFALILSLSFMAVTQFLSLTKN